MHTAKPIYDFEIADYADNAKRARAICCSSRARPACSAARSRATCMLIFDITEEQQAAADLDVPSARGARRLLPSRRPLRPALVRRRVSPGFRPEARRARVLQRRRARRRHPQSVRAERSRALHSGSDFEHDRVVHRDRRRAAVRSRDSNQQRQHRRSRLHLRASIELRPGCTCSSSPAPRARSRAYEEANDESDYLDRARRHELRARRRRVPGAALLSRPRRAGGSAAIPIETKSSRASSARLRRSSSVARREGGRDRSRRR